MEFKFEGHSSYKLTAEDGDYRITADFTGGDIDTVHLTFDSDSEVVPPVIELYWEMPSVDIQGTWHPTCHTGRGIPVVWSGYQTSSSAFSSPMYCLYSNGGENRLTFACSDAMNIVKYRFVLREEDSRWLCSSKLFDATIAPLSHYECTFRMDYSRIPYEDAIGSVVKWWADMPEYEPMEAVEECVHPLYSTWYSFHQYVDGGEIEDVLESAAPLGFKAVIVDDGWQMEDSGRTYAYCGDWEVCKKKIPDMKAHVAKVHSMGLKYYLWYSVPYVGKYSKAYERFRGMYFGSGETVVLDPRYPEVREYLISTYENAVKNWDLDGFKLDFIDNFHQPSSEDPNAAPGKDYVSVPQAVDRLMTDVKLRLKALKPNIAIEFRQSYIGPLMRKYGNMFRAADCANDTVTNKIRTIDTRLCVGSSPVHADMLTWNPEDTAASAALQLIGVMFAVPQISVRPARLPEDHRLMLKNWISFWEEYRDTLMGGRLRAYNPELMYTVVTAESDDCFVCGAYSVNAVIPAPEGDPSRIAVANGSGTDGVVVTVPDANYDYKIRDCVGCTLEEGRVSGCIVNLKVPSGGTVVLKKA